MLSQTPTKTIAILEALRSGDLPFGEYFGQLESHFGTTEPDILAFLPEEKRFARLLRESLALEEKYPDPASRPPLYGLPIAVKDIYHVDGFETHAGSKLPPEVLAGPEAKCVTQLKEAGALVLGKTVTTEFAYFAPGPTRNPHDLDHTPGGSSSGSAAAVAANLAPLALGTQTIGSIIRPASFCGVFGYKPTYDRISKAGVIPLASSVDHVGFFAPELESLSLVAGLLCRKWKPDAEVADRPVLGIPVGTYLEKAASDMQSFFNACCQKLMEAGYALVETDAFPNFEPIVSHHNSIVAAEAAQAHQAWFASYAELYHPKTAELIRRGQTIKEKELQTALESRLDLRSDLSEIMQEKGIDLWLSPSAPGPAPLGLESTGDPVMNLPWTHCGFPVVNLPAGYDGEGLPLGLQVTAGWYQDERLLRWSSALVSALE